MSFKERMEAIEGMDYETALMNSAGEEDFLKEIISDICDECDTRTERMRSLLMEDNLKDYSVEAHALKGLMATVGVSPLSEHAKKHEFESKAGNAEWVKQDSEALLSEYREICDTFMRIIKDEQ